MVLKDIVFVWNLIPSILIRSAISPLTFVSSLLDIIQLKSQEAIANFQHNDIAIVFDEKLPTNSDTNTSGALLTLSILFTYYANRYTIIDYHFLHKFTIQLYRILLRNNKYEIIIILICISTKSRQNS